MVVIATLIYLIIFLIVRNRFQLIEKNQFSIVESDDNVLDSEMAGRKVSYSNSLPFVFMLVLISGVFWMVFEVLNNELFSFYRVFEENGGVEVNSLFEWSAYISIITIAVLFGIWYLFGLGSTIRKIAIAMFMLGVGGIMVSFLDDVGRSNMENYAMGILVVFSIAEVFIGPILLSFITRLSDVKYSSTIIGGLILMSGLLTKI